MKKTSAYRTVITLTLAALVVLLVVQVYWFTQAYAIQEKQFDHTATLALRGVADKLLQLQHDTRRRIAPVQQTASNTFYVVLGRPVNYRQLDSLLRCEFRAHNIHAPFELAVFDIRQQALLFGSFYEHGVLTAGHPSCLKRENAAVAANFAITFPGRQADIVGAMGAWIFTAATCVVILIIFAFLLLDLSKQKKLAEVKSEFINNMTHELQTPVANIAMASEVLAKAGTAADTAKVVRYAGIIHQENQRLRFHIEQVLQTARLDRGEVAMHKKQVDLHALIQDVVQTFEVRVHQRQGHIQKDLQAAQASVQADPDHIAQVLFNLLDNADKYSQQQPQITISTRDYEKGVLVSVADRGIGIRQEVQKFIFDKFYRAPMGNRHDVKGFGLGLAYVQHIMAAHHGTVQVNSEENKGSRFDLFFQTA